MLAAGWPALPTVVRTVSRQRNVIMNRNRSHSVRALLGTSLLALALLAGCSDEPAGPGGNQEDTDTARVMMTFNVRTMAGTAPFALDSTFTSDAGIDYKVSKFIYFIHGITLIDTAGRSVLAELVNVVDTTRVPRPYNIALINYEQPETMTLRVLVPRGKYTGIRYSIGVPMFDASGVMLNHMDASTMEYPLNVDSDMYWGWKPGYIFLKIEGSARDKGDWKTFFYHIGDDKRLIMVSHDAPFTVAKGNASSRTLEVNVNRLFVTPTGQHSPNIVGTMEERTTHGGATADIVAGNATNSGFITMKP